MVDTREWSRRSVLTALSGLGIGSAVFARALWAQAAADGKVTADMIRQAEWIADLELTDQQRTKLAENLEKNRRDAARLREVPCDADVPPSSVFRPDFFCEPEASARLQTQRTPAPPHAPIQKFDQAIKPLPKDSTELAFASLIDQAAWLNADKLTSVRLTELYLDRINRFDPKLHLLVTSLAERAMEQAKASDQRRAAGKSLGILDGIPWVAKILSLCHLSRRHGALQPIATRCDRRWLPWPLDSRQPAQYCWPKSV